MHDEGEVGRSDVSAGEAGAAVVEFRAKLRAAIRRRVRDRATADDPTQETLLKVFRARVEWPDGQRVEAWLDRIGRNTLVDFYRRQRPTAELPEGLAGAVTTTTIPTLPASPRSSCDAVTRGLSAPSIPQRR